MDVLSNKRLRNLRDAVLGSAVNRKEKTEIGMSPYQLHFRGRKKTESVHLRIMDYGPETLDERALQSVHEAVALKDTPSVTWLNVDGLHDEAVMADIAQEFGFESIVLADAMNTRSRPKLVDYNDCLFVSLKMLREEEGTEAVQSENLSLILTPRMLLAFQEMPGDVFDPVGERIRAQKKRIRNSGPDYLLFALLDIVVDNYIYLIGGLGSRIEDLEDGLLQDSAKTVIEEINSYKRELNALRKDILPAREMTLALSKLECEFIDDEKNEVHFKELVDNINQAVDATNNYREILSDQLTIYHTTISSKLNDTMRIQTVFSVTFIPLTFIAGIYGTNFDVVPELHFRYGYFVMWGVTVLVAVGMLVYFRRNKWL